MMNSKKTIKVQTAFRFDPILIGRLKEAARMANISVNEYVTIVLTDATKDIESEMEKEERKKKTEDFLAKFAGAWSGDETSEQIMASIREGKKVRKIVKL